jgi:hypothetical protein
MLSAPCHSPANAPLVALALRSTDTWYEEYQIPEEKRNTQAK